MYDTGCLINGRAFGDAVIQSRSVKRLSENGFARRLLVWTRPEIAPAYEGLDGVEIIASPFPLVTGTSIGAAGLAKFWRAAQHIRRLRVDISIDFFGDMRERLFALMVGAGRHVAINWERGHPFRRSVRAMPGKRHAARVPCDVLSVYQAHQLFVNGLLQGGLAADQCPARAEGVGTPTIGIHPFASRECKRWPMGNWLRLCECLLERGYSLKLFGAPAEREALETSFRPVLSEIEIVAVGFRDFLQEAGEVDLMIGLDSLAVHAADRAGVPTVMLAGSNHTQMWRPPLGRSIGQSGGCPHYPCDSRPKCSARPDRYSCIRSVTVEGVLRQVDEQLHAMSSAIA